MILGISTSKQVLSRSLWNEGMLKSLSMLPLSMSPSYYAVEWGTASAWPSRKSIDGWRYPGHMMLMVMGVRLGEIASGENASDRTAIS